LCRYRKLVRRSLEIWTSPTNAENPHSQPSAARTKWKLAQILFALKDRLEEAQKFHKEACRHVKEQFGVDLGDDPGAETVVDSARIEVYECVLA
jgi:hypothetical protein